MRAIHKKLLKFKRLPPAAEATMRTIWRGNDTEDEIMKQTLESKATNKRKVIKAIHFLSENDYIAKREDRYIAKIDEKTYKKYCETYYIKHWEPTGGIFDQVLTRFVNRYFGSIRKIGKYDMEELKKLIEELYD